MRGIYLKNIVSLKLNEEKCTRCGVCTKVCPREVFELKEHYTIVSIIDRDRCIECGACALNCAFDALSVDAGVGCAYALLKRGGECKDDPSGKSCCE